MKDLTNKIEKMEEHLKNNPSDYQTKIQLLILKSRQIDYTEKKYMNMRLKRLAEIRREENE